MRLVSFALMIALIGYLYGRVTALNECRPEIDAAYYQGVHNALFARDFTDKIVSK